ncbi:hypothetical protein L6278_02410 [Candidatus Parcubacteria bacterium]|nr:hypothetical protein [Candidatus Parcubacteria bacterium]
MGSLIKATKYLTSLSYFLLPSSKEYFSIKYRSLRILKSLIPVSSINSRLAVSISVSPFSTLPFGNDQ